MLFCLLSDHSYCSIFTSPFFSNFDLFGSSCFLWPRTSIPLSVISNILTNLLENISLASPLPARYVRWLSTVFQLIPVSEDIWFIVFCSLARERRIISLSSLNLLLPLLFFINTSFLGQQFLLTQLSVFITISILKCTLVYKYFDF